MAAEISPAGSAPAGIFDAPSMDIARSEPDAIPTMGHRHDARAAELDNLKLALATFALQLDVFEMQTLEMRMGEPLKTSLAPEMPATARDTGRKPQKKETTGGQ